MPEPYMVRRTEMQIFYSDGSIGPTKKALDMVQNAGVEAPPEVKKILETE